MAWIAVIYNDRCNYYVFISCIRSCVRGKFIQNYLILFRMGLFRAAHRWKEGGGEKKAPLPKICYINSTVMKFGTIIHWLNKIQKMYKSHDTPLEFCWHKHFFTGNQQLLLYKETDVDCILTHIILCSLNFVGIF